MEIEKNIYGLSEGVFKACQFLGLKFPPEVPKELQNSQEHMPSDYFGDDFQLDSATQKKLRSARKWSQGKFTKIYKDFSAMFSLQKPIKQTKTDLNVYFCDYVLFADKQQGAAIKNYFYYEFYKKSFELRDTFLLIKHSVLRRIICNDYSDDALLKNKAKANEIFTAFLHRDWINTRKCTFEEFRVFIEKHPRFFSKLFEGNAGKGAQIISLNPGADLKKVFASFKSRSRLLEEVVTQHEALQAFCPDAVNTIRINTFLDIHNVVRILTASGRFGRVGTITDNLSGKGYTVTIDPETGIIISDGINKVHERAQKHPDTGKTFRGFQYPCWDKVRATVKEMAKMIPNLRHIGWDIAVNDKDEVVLIEVNVDSGVGVQQIADSVGRLPLYKPLIDELQNYKKEQMRLLGYRVNDLSNIASSYDPGLSRQNSRLQFAMTKLIPDCTSLMDLGCRKAKFVKSVCPENVKYYPVDFQKHDDEVIACDFNEGRFPDIKADICFCAFTAEYVEPLPQFLANMCNAAQKQILILCRPIDKERYRIYRWENPYLTDFTEEFLIKTMEQNNFQLSAQYPTPDNSSVILYDFRKNLP